MTRTSKITYTAIFAAIASVLMYFEFPLPFMPPFLQVDLSGVAVLIGAFIFGIRPAICMIIIKDVIHLTKSGRCPHDDNTCCHCGQSVSAS